MGGLAVGSLTLAAVDVRLASGRPSQGAGIDARPHRFGDLPASSRPFLGTWPRKSLHRILHRRSSARETRETVAVQCGAVRRALRSPGRAGSRHASVKRPGRREGCPSGYSMQRKTRHEVRGARCDVRRSPHWLHPLELALELRWSDFFFFGRPHGRASPRSIALPAQSGLGVEAGRRGGPKRHVVDGKPRLAVARACP
jgi:hypothetical protein